MLDFTPRNMRRCPEDTQIWGIKTARGVCRLKREANRQTVLMRIITRYRLSVTHKRQTLTAVQPRSPTHRGPRQNIPSITPQYDSVMHPRHEIAFNELN